MDSAGRDGSPQIDSISEIAQFRDSHDVTDIRMHGLTGRIQEPGPGKGTAPGLCQ